jgi:hypothetical protein
MSSSSSQQEIQQIQMAYTFIILSKLIHSKNQLGIGILDHPERSELTLPGFGAAEEISHLNVVKKELDNTFQQRDVAYGITFHNIPEDDTAVKVIQSLEPYFRAGRKVLQPGGPSLIRGLLGKSVRYS